MLIETVWSNMAEVTSDCDCSAEDVAQSILDGSNNAVAVAGGSETVGGPIVASSIISTKYEIPSETRPSGLSAA
jgi:hypothetical protein